MIREVKHLSRIDGRRRICAEDIIKAPVLVCDEKRNLCLTEKNWGYPGWQKKGVIFNARAESVTEKRIFQNGIHYHRTVIPVSGFYEWNHQKEKNQILPWLCENESVGKILKQEPVMLERYVPYEQQSLFWDD